MKLVLLIVAGALFFITHVGLSHGVIRDALVKKFTLWGFRGVYSLISIGTLGLAVYLMAVMDDADKGEFFWTGAFYLLPITYLLSIFGVGLVALSPATPSPTGMFPGKPEPKGVLKITRHPMNMGIAFWALGHMVANGSLGDLFFFGSLFSTGFLGAFHQDLRKTREGGDGFLKFKAQTSVLPFAALLTGKAKLDKNDFSVFAAAGAIVAVGIILYFHKTLFGASPF